MRCSGAFMVIAALATTACAETADENAGDVMPPNSTAIIDADTVRSDPSGSPDAPSPSDGPPADAPPASDAADTADAPADDPESETDDAASASIPSQFHGEWNADLAACGTGSSDTRLRISADRMRFYESTASVRAVEIESDRVISVTAEYQGEGDTWQDERRLSLSADGNSLSVSSGTGGLVRYRCP